MLSLGLCLLVNIKINKDARFLFLIPAIEFYRSSLVVPPTRLKAYGDRSFQKMA